MRFCFVVSTLQATFVGGAHWATVLIDARWVTSVGGTRRATLDGFNHWPTTIGSTCQATTIGSDCLFYVLGWGMFSLVCLLYLTWDDATGQLHGKSPTVSSTQEIQQRTSVSIMICRGNLH